MKISMKYIIVAVVATLVGSVSNASTISPPTKEQMVNAFDTEYVTYSDKKDDCPVPQLFGESLPYFQTFAAFSPGSCDSKATCMQILSGILDDLRDSPLKYVLGNQTVYAYSGTLKPSSYPIIYAASPGPSSHHLYA